MPELVGVILLGAREGEMGGTGVSGRGWRYVQARTTFCSRQVIYTVRVGGMARRKACDDTVRLEFTRKSKSAEESRTCELAPGSAGPGLRHPPPRQWTGC